MMKKLLPTVENCYICLLKKEYDFPAIKKIINADFNLKKDIVFLEDDNSEITIPKDVADKALFWERHKTIENVSEWVWVTDELLNSFRNIIADAEKFNPETEIDELALKLFKRQV